MQCLADFLFNLVLLETRREHWDRIWLFNGSTGSWRKLNTRMQIKRSISEKYTEGFLIETNFKIRFMLLYHKSTPAFLCSDCAQEIRLGQEKYEICT